MNLLTEDVVIERFTAAEIGAMARAVAKLLDRWGVTDAQAAVLLAIPADDARALRTGGRVSPTDGGMRLSHLLGIHAALRTIFVEPERGYDWIKAPNATFDGRSALDVMLGGGVADLARVRACLEAELHG